MSDECQCEKCKPKPEFSHYGMQVFTTFRLDRVEKSLRIDYSRDGDVRFVFTGQGPAQTFLLSVWSLSDIIERLFEIRDFHAKVGDGPK